MNRQLRACLSKRHIQRWAERPNHQLTVGLIHHSARSIWTSGQGNGVDSSQFLYEIGSITKTMTGLLLAIGEKNGVWSPSDRLSDFVPEWSSSPFARGTTLLQLATHTSGLPMVPKNMKGSIINSLNPYANYKDDDLISAVALESPKKSNKHSYSNYGFGLLGWLFARRLGGSLDEALRDLVFKPLGMVDTAIRLPEDQRKQMLPVFNAKGKPVPHWDFGDTMAGAGAVRSTVSDMLHYIDAQLSDTDHSLHTSLAECRKAQHDIFPSRGVGIGFGWMFFREKDGSTTHWHNGGTYGSSSFATFNRDKRIGLVILSNNGSDIWSQLAPMIGIRKMSVDMLATLLTKELFKTDFAAEQSKE
ncbi:beta-lactamase family protein [Paenibacillus sp. SYP-B3998]|uniref:Beta-lactamase family protein n=1 Tax=Paenibacillus sp. SYP-B3998 TaxID=2678564 RepID=A0A6G4A3L8_9BACL|nr:serine hydrolase domain-containing protein [Paenibacillus sp. SYP-B3998]NEW08982.1 beta-lactamase family protein [Paenibacillus sp. SYP-B3998]